MKQTRWLPVVAAAFALGSGGFVHAQTNPTGVHKAEDKSVMVMPLNATIEDVEEMEIYGPNGEKVGEVESVQVMPPPNLSRLRRKSGASSAWARRTW